MVRIAVLVSGSGSNLQAILDAVVEKRLQAHIVCVLADRECYAIERAKTAGVVTKVFDRKRENVSESIPEYLQDKADLIVMAGFLSVISDDFCCRWRGKMINIHPSLLPKFGGAGMYGIKVHQAVLSAGEQETGATIHYVTEEVDGGETIMQKKIAIPRGITAEELQKKVLLEVEHGLLIEALQKIVREWRHV